MEQHQCRCDGLDPKHICFESAHQYSAVMLRPRLPAAVCTGSWSPDTLGTENQDCWAIWDTSVKVSPPMMLMWDATQCLLTWEQARVQKYLSRIQQLSELLDHGGHHVTPVEERRTLLLTGDLSDDHLPGYSLIEKLHHGLRAQGCGGINTGAINTGAFSWCSGERSSTHLICGRRELASRTAAALRGAAGWRHCRRTEH